MDHNGFERQTRHFPATIKIDQLDKPGLIYCVTWLCKFSPLPFGLFREFYKLKPKLVGITNKNRNLLKWTEEFYILVRILTFNYFWNMCPKPFSWAKNKRELFSDGKSREPLLARAAIKRASSWLNMWKHGFKPRKIMTMESWKKEPANETNHLKVSKTKNDWKYELNSLKGMIATLDR